MFYIVVRFTDKPGKYPVLWHNPTDGYVISEKRFHDNDNPGSPVTAEVVGKIAGDFALSHQNIKDITIVRYERLYVFKPGEKKPFAWVYFVYGNDGWDVISDYTTKQGPTQSRLTPTGIGQTQHTTENYDGHQ